MPPLDRTVLTQAKARLSEWAAAGALWRRRRRELAGAAISLALHAVILALVILSFGPVSLESPPPQTITVELITEPIQEPESRIGTTTAPAIPEAPLPDAVALPRISLSELAPAREIFSDAALDQVARRSLSTLAGDARLEQLCNVEAMEQIAHTRGTYEPEKVIAYLTSDTRRDGETLVADGAAFLSRGHWYALAYRCRTTRDRQKVVAFDFATGTQFEDDYPGLPRGDDDD